MGFQPAGLRDTLYAWAADEPDEQRRRDVWLAAMAICEAPLVVAGVQQEDLGGGYALLTAPVLGTGIVLHYLTSTDGESGVNFVELFDGRTDTSYRFMRPRE